MPPPTIDVAVRPTPTPWLPRPTPLPPPAAMGAAATAMARAPAASREPTPRRHLQPTPRWPTLTPTPVLTISKRSPRRKRTPTPVPGQDAAALLPEPTVQLPAATAPSLGCLDSAPQPFGEGGVYLSFCLSKEAWVRVLVYGDRGKQLWRSPEKGLAAGRQQWFFDGRVNRVPLTAGTYVFEVQARYPDGQRESRQGTITRAPKKRT